MVVCPFSIMKTLWNISILHTVFRNDLAILIYFNRWTYSIAELLGSISFMKHKGTQVHKGELYLMASLGRQRNFIQIILIPSIQIQKTSSQSQHWL